MHTAFDTLTFSQRLQQAGASKALADEHAQLVREMVMTDLVTKSDLDAALNRQTLTFGGMLMAAIGILLTALPFLIR